MAHFGIFLCLLYIEIFCFRLITWLFVECVVVLLLCPENIRLIIGGWVLPLNTSSFSAITSVRKFNSLIYEDGMYIPRMYLIAWSQFSSNMISFVSSSFINWRNGIITNKQTGSVKYVFVQPYLYFSTGVIRTNKVEMNSYTIVMVHILRDMMLLFLLYS